MSRCYWFFVATAFLVLQRPAARAAVLEAGAARIDITPPLGCPLWGFFDRMDKPATGVRDPLQARALVLSVGTDQLALVSMDLGRAPPRAVTKSLRARLKSAVGIEHFFLVASHTHCGPVLELSDVPAGKPYNRQLEDKLFEVVVEAVKVRQPARLGIAAKDVPLNRNRHSKFPDAPHERELLLLRVEAAGGKLLAHAVNYPAHATLLGSGEMRWSADWPGAMAGMVEKETGVPCLFLQGAAGDLTIDRSRGNTPEIFGQAIAREVLALANNLHCELPAAASLRVAEEDFTFPSRRNRTNRPGQGFNSPRFPALASFYEREYEAGVRPHLTAAVLNGRIGLVGVSGEFFCGHALRLKKRARLDHLFFMGYCNDHQGYFPTIEAVAEGGYGTEPYSAPAALGAGELIMDRALLHLYELRGQLK